MSATALTPAAGDGSQDPYEFRLGLMPLFRLNVLEQVRKTYDADGITELCQSIAGTGLINEIQVAYMTPAQARDYVQFVSALWHRDYGLADILRMDPRQTFEQRTERGRPVYRQLSDRRLDRYAVVVCGHRRYFAMKQLWEMGCEQCQETYGTETPGACWARHMEYEDSYVRVKLYSQLPPYEAMALQYQENVHQRPPAHQQADAYDNLFVLAQQRNPELTVVAFAKQVRASTGTITRARRFCALPLQIRADVEQGAYGKGSFGIAMQLERLIRTLEPVPETLESWRLRAIAVQPRADSFTREVSATIARHRGGNVSFGVEDPDAFGEVYMAGVEAAGRKSVLLRALVMQLFAGNEYLSRALPELLSGNIGHPGRLFWDTSTIAVWRKLLGLLAQTEPLLAYAVEEARKGEARQLAERDIPLLDELATLLLTPPTAEQPDLFSS